MVDNLNTLGTTNGILIAMKALETLLAKLPFLGQITQDFSDQKAKLNQTIITHVVTPAQAIPFDPAVGYAASPRTQIDVPVTITDHVHHTYAIGVQEASSTAINLIERFAVTAAYSVGQALVNKVCALIKAAAFPNASVFPLGAGGDGFDRKCLIKCGVALGKRFVPPVGRFALLNSDYYGSLANDLTVVAQLYNQGQNAIQSGLLSNVHGFDVSEYVALPDNGENLVGIAGTVDSLVLATRIPDDPGEGNAVVDISTITDPKSGISMQMREWYNADLAQYKRTYTLMFGAAIAQAAALQRITSK
jgi:hypothetical protein